MGYNSSFEGNLHPDKPIPEELVRQINDAELDVVVAPDDDWDPGSIVPASSYMHGYAYVEDIARVQRLLARNGISLSGEIERSGDASGDYDKVEVVGGKVYYHWEGKVTYGRRREISDRDLTRYAIRAYQVPGGGGPREFVGWVDSTGSVYPCGKESDRPPYTGLEFTKELAGRLMNLAASRAGTGEMEYELTSRIDDL